MDHLKRLLLILLTLLVYHQANSQQVKTMSGTDFWMGYMDNRDILNNVSEPTVLKLILSSQVNTSGTISIPHMNWYYNFVIESDSTLEIIVPKELARHASFNVIERRGVHIESEDPVSVAAINRLPYSADGTSVFPKEMIGSEYYLVSYAANVAPVTGRSEFLIVATEDNTVIRITPKVALIGRPANVMYSIVLNKGESYQNSAASNYSDVSGSYIVGAPENGTCKPFAVFSGSQSTYVPSSCELGDHLYEQLPPVTNWGTRFFCAPFAQSTNYTIKIVAKTNGTQITTNPNATPIVLNQGQTYSLSTPGTRVISSSQPVSVYRFTHGGSCGGAGDPSLSMVNSEQQQINYARFKSYDNEVLDTHYVNIVVPTVDRHLVYLDNMLIPAASFTAFTAYATMSYAKVPLSAGMHELQSTALFQADTYGIGNAESYAYSLGWYQPLESPVDHLICTIEDTLLTAPAGQSQVWWSTSANPSDTLIAGMQLLVQQPSANNIYLANGVSADGCEVTTAYSIENPANAAAAITAPTQVACLLSAVPVSISSALNASQYTVEWTPNDRFDDPFAHSTVLHPEQTGWYSAHISSMAENCYAITDSIYFTVGGGEITGFDAGRVKNVLCFGDTAALDVKIYKKAGFDDFTDEIDSTLWSSVQGATFDNTCGSYSGTALYFNGAAPRSAITAPIDVSAGGKLSFYLKTGTSTGTCDDPEAGEDISLQYSIDNGATWVTFRTLYEYYFTSFMNVEQIVPAAALTSATKFRLIQTSFSGAGQDIWMLDHFLISAADISTVVSWSPATFLTPVGANTALVYPESTTVYTATITSQGCIYQDSVTVLADDFSFTIESSFDCDAPDGTLTVHVSDSNQYNYAWQSENMLPALNDSIIHVSPVVSGDTYQVAVISQQGCVVRDSITVSPLFFEIAILGDSAICAGDSTVLNANAYLSSIDYFDAAVPDSAIWWNITGGSVTNNCSVLSGSNLYFGNGVRSCETRAFDFSNGGVLSFGIAFGTGSTGYSANSCIRPLNNQYIIIEYSINNGMTWNYLSNVGPGPIVTPAFQSINLVLPPAAWSPATKFRWKQNNVSAGFGANWMLENVALRRYLATNYTFSWLDNLGNEVASGPLLNAHPAATTTYTVQLTDTLHNCVKAAEVTVQVGTPYSVNISDLLLCGTDTVTLTAQPPSGDSYSYNWYANSYFYPTTFSYSGSGPSVTLPVSSPTLLIITSEAASGCKTRDTIAIDMLFDNEYAQITGDTAICSGASGELTVRLQDTKLYPCQTAYEFADFSGVANGTGCGSQSGNALYFYGQTRYLTLNAAIPAGGNIAFYLKSGDGNCDPTEAGDDLIVEYSVDNGASWQAVGSVSVYQVYQFQHFTLEFPALASSLSTLVRLKQAVTDGQYTDIIVIDEVAVTSYSALPLNYSWTSGGTVISTAAQTSVPVQEQLYYVTVSDANNTCFFYDSVLVDIFDYSVNAGTDTLLCTLSGYVLTGTTDCSYPYSVQWSNETNLEDDTTLHPELISDNSLSYILAVSSNGCVRYDTVSVGAFPDLALDIASAFTKCESDTVFIDMTGAASINWNNAPGIVSLPGNTAALTSDQNASYTLNYNDVNGCAYTDNLTVAVNELLEVSLPADASICSYDVIAVTAQSNVSDPLYVWNTGSNANPLPITAPGIYWVEVTDECGTVRDSITVTHLSIPVPLITATNTVLSVQQSYQSYQWFSCATGNPVAGAVSQSFSPVANGSYAVIVSDGTCEDTSACFTINQLSVSSETGSPYIEFVFNASTSELIVEFDHAAAEQLEVYDYAGKLVLVKKELVSGTVTDLSHLSAGIYLLRAGGASLRIFTD